MINNTTVNLLNSSINYIDPNDSNAPKIVLLENDFPTDLEIADSRTVEELKLSDNILSKISKRNYKKTYIIPVASTQVLLNFIPQKMFVLDSGINRVLDSNFEFFVDDDLESSLPLNFSLLEGTIFRIVTGEIKPIEQYTHYIINNDLIEQIPNFKSVQVMLAQRGQTIADIKIIELKQFNEMLAETSKLKLERLLASGIDPSVAAAQASQIDSGTDSQGQWTSDLEATTVLESFASLAATSSTAASLVQAAAAAAQANIDMVNAESAATSATAAAATAAANQAIAEAENLTSSQTAELNTLGVTVDALDSRVTGLEGSI